MSEKKDINNSADNAHNNAGDYNTYDDKSNDVISNDTSDEDSNTSDDDDTYDDEDDDTYDDEDDIIEYELYQERQRKRREFTICGIISLILIVLSPIINALIASILCSSPQYVYIPFVAIAVMIVYTLSIMHQKEYANKIALKVFPLVISTIAGSLFYTYIRHTDYFHNGIAKYICSDGKEGIINRFGFSTVKPIYTYINVTDNSLMIAQQDSMKGVISKQGDVVIPLKYKYITELQIDSISPTYAFKVTNFAGKTGLVADNGKPMIPLIYDDLRYWNTDPINNTALFTAYINNNYGIINIHGKVIEPCKYFLIEDVKDNVAKVNIGGQLSDSIVIGGYWGYINRSGVEVIPCRFDSIGVFDEHGTISVSDGIHIFTYNKNGDLLDLKN